MGPTNKKVITNAVEYGIFLSVRTEIFGNKFYIASVNANCKNKVPCPDATLKSNSLSRKIKISIFKGPLNKGGTGS